ncbi:hypothetical protein HXY33_01625 [Candidatus Bathyarchaeota archaeon]|nr:hypothetical protein [Candidatus Bathyarchaeota archaeon]
MRRLHVSLVSLVTVSIILWVMLSTPTVRADPVAVSWLVKDATGTPIDGAWLTIYYSTSPEGPFTTVPADAGSIYVEDRIANPDVNRNPVISGYWNPDHNTGLAFADVHVPGVEGFYFYVEINYASNTWYWPIATSIKPGDSSWAPVLAPGSPTGYAASGNGIGNGPTTAYPTCPPPDKVIPEVPLGPLMATTSMIVAFGAYFGLRKRKLAAP